MMFFTLAGILILIVTLPGTIELLLLTVGAIVGKFTTARYPNQETPTTSLLKLGVVIPAHNEAGGIAACVKSVLACQAAGVDLQVVVIADNCTDMTAQLAKEAGARVIVRMDQANRGKGFALDVAFGRLLREGIEAFVVIDADTEVEPNFITEMAHAFQQGADAVQCRYLVNNAQFTFRTRLMNVALLAFNVLRPLGRNAIGCSAGIFGNGFGLSATTLCEVPYSARSVVEDLEYHLKLVKAGKQVRFLNSTTVRAEMPAGGRAAQTQRSRWEGGRIRMMLDFAPSLIRDIARGERRLIEPLLDLLLLPLAFHVVLLASLMLVPNPFLKIYAASSLAMVLFHVLSAVWVGEGTKNDVLALLGAPLYILWKMTMVRSVVRSSRKKAEWVRTERAAPNQS
ncbi:MAG TPA: glycosyltransferase family 2 protein [Acidobacteriota bacterium]|nr:glycosyltransferase family 2 protein [Acidobacteriota bacterium]HND18016.1 glycosyltransferase family 2 protein [Acidobacteriota bacterium]HNG93024.1 glycosyltransferase family 2 protein [Acidobacteriota bacterium]HNH83622.1 glycosyltransferase family 2 protein [Acidobacteriota bacterium]